jgi:predicted dehydrogenase
MAPESSKMYKGALIGLGNVGLGGHLPGWQSSSDFQIVMGVDPVPDRRALLTKMLPDAATFASIAELPAWLDFVDICTPPHTHFELVLYSLERGLHVLCEKPLVLSKEQFDQAQELAREKERVLCTVHNWKFAPICRKIIELILRGALGEIHRCAWHVLRNGPCNTTDPENWRLNPRKAGGGILVDHGWHAFYLVLEWFGLAPVGVRASLENRRYVNLEVEDTALITVQFERTNSHSPVAEIFLTWASNLRRNWGVIQGSLGQLGIEDDSLRLDYNDGTQERFQFGSRLSTGSQHSDWFEFVVREFAEELNGSCVGANLKIAQQCLRLVERSKAASQAKEFLPI